MLLSFPMGLLSTTQSGHEATKERWRLPPLQPADFVNAFHSMLQFCPPRLGFPSVMALNNLKPYTKKGEKKKMNSDLKIHYATSNFLNRGVGEGLWGER